MADGRLDLRDRDGLFASLEARPFDLAVIGGGVTGAGIARDGALRGLSVALVEAGDFASGTSSRSTKMIHGGLRYLAQGDIGLVREAASERRIVEAIAPHLARETPYIIPARSVLEIARLRAGLWVFEMLGGVPPRRRHQVWSRAQLEAREPLLKAQTLAGAVVYPEFLTDDSRLTLANVRSADAAGAIVANYARAESLVFEGARAAGLIVAETLPGAGERRARVGARVIVNAAGPWVDTVRALEEAAAPSRLELSRGIHIVMPHAHLPIAHAVIMTAADKRGVFAIPKAEATYVGTTDTFYPEPAAWPAVTAQDCDYLLATVMATFSVEPMTAGDITSVWSGVRPLVAQPGKSASEISRRDELWTGPAGMLSIAGGKLTAYRRMAQRAVDKVEEMLGRRPSACRTAAEPLVGGDVDAPAMRRELVAGGASEALADRLVRLYGAEAPLLARDGGGPAAEASQAVLAEGALTLEDWWVRRSVRAWFDPDAGLAALPVAAGVMAPLLGWSTERQEAEIEACRARHAQDMAALTAPATVALG